MQIHTDTHHEYSVAINEQKFSSRIHLLKFHLNVVTLIDLISVIYL